MNLRDKGDYMFKSLASRLANKIKERRLSLAAGSFPHIIRVECTNACNATCIICPHQRMKRPVAVMADELYERIVSECAGHSIHEFNLHNFGEPLMDRKLEDRIRLAKEAGLPKVKIFSNGSLLTEERIRGLLKAGLDEIVISFDGATREEFEMIRSNLKFDTVVGNVNTLIRLRNELRSPLHIRLTCCSTQDISQTRLLLPREGVDNFTLTKIHNWATEGEAPSSNTRKPCSRVWRTFTILASGEVALCCLDYDGRIILGDLKSGQSIRDIWRGEPYRRIRQLHISDQQAEVEICAACSESFV